MRVPPQVRTALAACVVIASAALGACAQIPIINESQLLRTDPSSQRITVYGARGPLSARQSRVLIARVDAQAPDAGALDRHLAIEQTIAESPLYAGNRVRVLRDGPEAFSAIFDAIAGAHHFLYLEYYIFEDVSSNGRDLGQLLAEKSREGVQVSVIYDAVGSIGTPSAFFDQLRAAGIQVVEFNPINPFNVRYLFSVNDRDHRKLLVADGTLAIVGGVNLSTDYQSAPSAGSSAPPRTNAGDAGTAYKPQEVWHDLDIEIRGPVVPVLGALFRDHWKEQTARSLPVVNPPARSEIEGEEIVRILGSRPTRITSRYYVTVLSAILNAESSVWITAAYFVPTLQELADLKAAARRGVDVRLILPSHSDWAPVIAIQRSHYIGLIKAGVKIYERNDGIVHSKSLVIDKVWSLVGSSNFDQRSILFNDEVDAVMLGKATADQLTSVFESDMQHARRISVQDVRQFGMLERLRGKFWSLWEKLL